MLDGGIFDGCSFYAADLSGCSLKNASLRRCNLSRARLRGLDVGALPALRPFGSCASAAGGGGAAAVAAAADKKAQEEMIGRVEVSADGAVVAVLSGDGRSGKVRVVCMRFVFAWRPIEVESGTIWSSMVVGEYARRCSVRCGVQQWCDFSFFARNLWRLSSHPASSFLCFLSFQPLNVHEERSPRSR